MAENRTVEAEDNGIRVDRWFKRHYPALAHGALEKLLRTGQLRVDGKRAKASDRLSTGQLVRLPPQFHQPVVPCFGQNAEFFQERWGDDMVVPEA